MKVMLSKFSGTCRACGGAIQRGSEIQWSRSTGAVHVDCGNDEDERNEDDAFNLERGTLANDRRMATRGLSITRFASGEVHTQNSRGRCEDAPCCGCCS